MVQICVRAGDAGQPVGQGRMPGIEVVVCGWGCTFRSKVQTTAKRCQPSSPTDLEAGRGVRQVDGHVAPGLGGGAAGGLVVHEGLQAGGGGVGGGGADVSVRCKRECCECVNRGPDRRVDFRIGAWVRM